MLNVYTPFAARSLNVEIIGFESTNWVEVTERVDVDGAVLEDIIIRAPRHARRDFFEVNVPLYTFDASQLLAPGQYQFPFRVLLPVNLPGSFLYEDPCFSRDSCTYEDIVGKVRYKVAAGVVRGPTPNGICSELYDSHEIIVRQRLVRAPSELVAETTTTVKCCCFSSKGMVVVRVRADKDSYAAGEMANVLLEVENHTDLSFPEVWVEIDRVVHLATHHSQYRHEDRVLRHRFAGLAKGESHVGASAQRLSFQIPPSFVPTTLGSLVRCTYGVWVELSAGALTNNPRLWVPLTIYAAQPAQVAYAAPPPAYWKPQVVAPAVEVTLPSAPPMDAALPSAPPMAAPVPGATAGPYGGYTPPPMPPAASTPATGQYGGAPGAVQYGSAPAGAQYGGAIGAAKCGGGYMAPLPPQPQGGPYGAGVKAVVTQQQQPVYITGQNPVYAAPR